MSLVFEQTEDQVDWIVTIERQDANGAAWPKNRQWMAGQELPAGCVFAVMRNMDPPSRVSVGDKMVDRSVWAEFYLGFVAHPEAKTLRSSLDKQGGIVDGAKRLNVCLLVDKEGKRAELWPSDYGDRITPEALNGSHIRLGNQLHLGPLTYDAPMRMELR